MANESTAQLPLTRRELRELERQQREAQLAEEAAAERLAEKTERAAAEPAFAEPVFLSRRERREAELAEAARLAVETERLAAERAAAEAERLEAERAAAEAERLEVERAAAEAARLEAERLEVERAAAEAARLEAERAAAEAERLEVERAAAEAERLAAQAAADAEPVFLSRRERREAERAALERLEAESAVAAAQVAAERPELFAVPAPAAEHGPELPVVEAPAEPEQREPLAPVISLEVERELRRASGHDVPQAPSDEPELEFAAAFARQGRAARDSRARRIILSNRRSSSAGRFGGSMVAMSFLAGTVVLGAGSAAAIGAMGSQHGEAASPQATDLVEPQQLTVGITDTLAVSAPRADEATAVTSIGTAAAANLATGVKLPDDKAYTNDITANVQYPFPMGVKLTDTYGPRVSPTSGASSWHGGVDFTPGESTPVGAIADGVVISVDGASTTTYGNYVEVQHVIDGVQVVSLYAHLETGSITVKAGDTVSVGDQLGTVGTTGASTGPHLHLEVRVEGNTVDPMYFLQKLNVPGVTVELPMQLVAPNATGVYTKIGVAESHALIDERFGR